MSVTIDLPTRLEERLRVQWGDLPRAAKEALAIESYRMRKISIGLLAEMLGMGVIEADGWLKERGVDLPYNDEDLADDRSDREQANSRQ